MKKATTILLLLFLFGSISAQIPVFSAATNWRVADGNNTWIGTALDLRAYCLAGAGVIPAGGTAGQVLSKIDGTNYNTQWVTSGGSGDIVNGGNTTGAEVIIGTNDANTLSLETNAITRASINSSGMQTHTAQTANTVSVDQHLWRLNSTGATSNNFGLRHLIQLETSTTDNRDAVGLKSYWAAGTDASRTSNFELEMVNSAGALTPFYRFQPGTFRIYTTSGAAALVFTAFDFTPTGNYVINGGSTGAAALGLATTGSSGITVSNNTATSTVPMMTVGSSANSKTHSSGTYNETSYLTQINPSSGSAGFNILNFSNTINQTSTFSGSTSLVNQSPILTNVIGTFNGLNYNPSYTASSGSAATTGYNYNPTLNLTATHSGVHRGLRINPTLTALVSAGQFIGLDLPFSNTNAIGINQTGASTTNYMVGPTVVGSTATDASAALLVNSTTKGFGLPIMTSAQKEAIASPRQGLEVFDTDLDGKCVYDGTKWFRLSQESTPTIAVGAGAGTGATVSVVGNDIEGVITLTGGTGATASATVFTLTFFDSYTSAPHGVIITPADTDVANFPAGRTPAFDTVSTTTFTMINASVNGITNAVVYKYAYRVIQ